MSNTQIINSKEDLQRALDDLNEYQRHLQEAVPTVSLTEVANALLMATHDFSFIDWKQREGHRCSLEIKEFMTKYPLIIQQIRTSQNLVNYITKSIIQNNESSL